MIRTFFLISGFFFFINVFSQDLSFIKTEKNGKWIRQFYNENQNSILVKILNKSGDIKEIRRYSDISLKTENGEWTEYYSKNQIKAKRYFENGLPVGSWIQYTKKGEINSQKNYNFELLYELDTSKINSDIRYSGSEVIGHERIPQFKGGLDSLKRAIVSDLIPLDDYMIEKYSKLGRIDIIVKFTIEKDGTVMNIRVKSQDKKMLEKDAVRIVRNFPKWIPGNNSNGELCSVDYTIPIIYVFPE